MTSRGAIAAVAAALALAGLGQPAAAQVPADADWQEQFVTSEDGTRLHADVYRPKGLRENEKTPVLLRVSPYLGLGAGSGGARGPATERPVVGSGYQDIFDRAFKRGYTVVQVTSRGFGASGGCSDFFGPKDQADAEAAIRWAAGQGWSTGRVGTFGGSADAAAQVAALARRVPGHAAALITSPVSSAYRLTYMNRNRLHNANLGVAHWLFQAFSTYPAPLSSPPDHHAEAVTGIASTYGCAPEVVAEPENPDPGSEFWRARDMIGAASGNSVPTLWAHGFADDAAMPDQVHEIYASQRGPKRIWWAHVPHVATSGWQEQAGRGAQFVEEAFRWFDRYVKGASKKLAPVERDPGAVVQEGFEGGWRAEDSWPPTDASDIQVPVRPGSYQDAEGNKAEPGFRPGSSCTQPQPRCAPVPNGVGSWTFTHPLPHDAHIAGVPRLTVAIQQRAPAVNVIALLYDVDPEDRAALIARGAFVSRASGPVAFDLYPTDWRIRKGHRIGLLLTGSDEFHFSPGTSGTTVDVADGKLGVPFLTYERTRALDGEPSQWIKNRQTFAVNPSDATVDSPLPPPLVSPGRKATGLPRLSASIRPRRTVAGGRTTFRIRVSVRRGAKRAKRVRGATVRLLGAHGRTARNGYATLTVRPRRGGRYRVTASKPGYRSVHRTVTITRR